MLVREYAILLEQMNQEEDFGTLLLMKKIIKL
jgi:hypothetical protein